MLSLGRNTLGERGADFMFALTRKTGVSFNLDAFMAAEADGGSFDFTETDRLFQENTGPTPADNLTEVIGLALENRLWNGQTLAEVLAGQTEKVPNSTFDSGVAGWAAIGAASIAAVNGQMELNVSGAGGASRASINCVVGRMYRVSALARRGTTVQNPRLSVAGVIDGPQVSSTSLQPIEFFFTATATTHNLDANIASSGTGTAYFDNVSVKEVPGKHGIQATNNFKPKLQSDGAKYDGSDDRTQVPYGAGAATDNWWADRPTIPATIAATQALFGAVDSGGNSFYGAVLTDGNARFKVGSTTLDSTGVDLRGGQHRLCFRTVGAMAYIDADGVTIASGAWTGTIPITEWRLGALNNNGTPAAFFGGSLIAPKFGRSALTLGRSNQITNALPTSL